MEIDIDGIFVRLLLLKKKKYAGIKVTDWKSKDFESEYKGLDLVRRDWCELSKRIGRSILAKVLSLETPLEEAVEWVHEYLRSMATEIDAQKVEVREFVITKALTKDPKDYPDAKNQPHVQVALRMLNAGDTVVGNQEIPYIICKTEASSIALRARHPREVEASSLEIDLDWYKKQQLHPPILRLLGPVEGTDAARIAECLGLDGSRFLITEGLDKNIEVTTEMILDPISRFRQLHLDFDILCPHCTEHIELRETLQLDEKLELKQDSVAHCSKCQEAIHPTIVENQSVVGVRQLLNKYALCETQCTEPMCKNLSRDVSLRGCGDRCEIPKCNATCEKTFSEQHLQNQLDLLRHMFSVALEDYTRGTKVIDSVLQNSEHNWIRGKDFFGAIFGA